VKLSSEQIEAQKKKGNPDEHLCKVLDHKCCFHPQHSNTDNQHVQLHLKGNEQESPGQTHLHAGFIDRLINWISSGIELFFFQSFYTIL